MRRLADVPGAVPECPTAKNLQKRARVCIDRDGGHFEQLLQYV